MRRVRSIVLLLGVMSLLIGPSATPTKAQVPEDGFEVAGTVLGRTDPSGFPPDNETLGLNRVSGPSRFINDTGFQINLIIVCRDAAGNEELVLAPDLRSDHPVSFWADDDLTDGFGEVTPTDTDRAFRTGRIVPAVEARLIPPGAPSLAQVEVRIISGRFHRLGNWVDVDLRLDIRVVRDDEGLTCQTRDSNPVEVRIIFKLLPDPLTLETPTAGFLLLGEITRHHMDLDRISIARTVCDTYQAAFTAVSMTSPRVTVPGQSGDPLHPCAPRYGGG